jgi:opine dehydrogenase
VIGAGHGGLAMAGHLGIMGFPVALYNRTGDNLNGVRWHGGVKVSGEVKGFGPVQTVTTDIAEAVAGADVIMVVTPATAHRHLAEIMAPHLVDGQIVVLNPGRTGGALEFRAVLQEAKTNAAVVIAETQTFLYTSRAVSRSEGHIYKVKNAVPLATLPAYWIPDTLAVVNQAFPCFVAGNTVLSTSMENIGAVFHPALTILNAGWIEATGGDFDYYLQGITPSIAVLLEKVDAERIAVATGLGLHSATAREWLYRSYDSSGRNLHEAIHSTLCYAGIKAPPNIAHRYIFEDVPMSLVPIASIGALLGIATPTIDMVINLGSILHGRDFRSEGRTVSRLGLAGLSVKQIRQLVEGVEADRIVQKE